LDLVNRGAVELPNLGEAVVDVAEVLVSENRISNSQHSISKGTGYPLYSRALPGLAGVFLLTHARPEGNERVSRWSKCAV
jgi:hypothetical protein